jgi:hypothetical protein
MARKQQSTYLHRLSPDLDKQSLGALVSSLDEAIKSLTLMVPMRLTENLPGEWNPYYIYFETVLINETS